MVVPVIVTCVLIAISFCNAYVVYDEVEENHLCSNITLNQKLNEISNYKLQAVCIAQLIENYDGQLTNSIQKYLKSQMLAGKYVKFVNIPAKVEFIETILTGIKKILGYWIEGIFKHSFDGLPKKPINPIAVKEYDFFERFVRPEYHTLKEIFINWEGVYDDINDDIINFINKELAKIEEENNTEEIHQIKESSNEILNKIPNQNILQIDELNSNHKIYDGLSIEPLYRSNTFIRNVDTFTIAEVRQCCKEILRDRKDGELIAVVDIMPYIENIMQNYSNRTSLTSELKELTMNINNGVQNILRKFAIDKLMQSIESKSKVWIENSIDGELNLDENINRTETNSNMPTKLQYRLQKLKKLLRESKEDLNRIKYIVLRINSREQLEVTKDPKSKIRKQLNQQMHEWMLKQYHIYEKIPKIEGLIKEIKEIPLAIENFKLWMKNFMVKTNQ